MFQRTILERFRQPLSVFYSKCHLNLGLYFRQLSSLLPRLFNGYLGNFIGRSRKFSIAWFKLFIRLEKLLFAIFFIKLLRRKKLIFLSIVQNILPLSSWLINGLMGLTPFHSFCIINWNIFICFEGFKNKLDLSSW